MQAWEQVHVANLMDIQITSSCTHCGWSQTGWLATVSENFAAHRLEQHPELPEVKRRKKHRVYGQINGGKGLDENIENARSQGAAGWANEPA
jgi:hypothetical protein